MLNEKTNIIPMDNTNDSTNNVQTTETDNSITVTPDNLSADKVIDLDENSATAKETKGKATKNEIKLPEIKPSEVPVINYDDFRPIFNYENMSDEQICDGAMNRLTQDTYFGINGLPLIACWLHIYNKARTDVDFAKQVVVKSKSFNKAFDYLSKEIKALCGSGNMGIGVDHRQIFAILEDYYYLDDQEIAEKEAARKAKEEKKRKENAEKAKAASNKKKKEKAEAKEKAKATEEKKKAKEKEEQAQANLFDLLGGSL